MVALAWTASAAAYCRTMSCELGEDPEKPCARDRNDCVTQGKPLHWANSCLDYAVQLDGSPRSGLDADQVQVFVEQAFAAWKTAPCPGGGTPRFEVRFQGFVSCDRRESVCGGANKNVNVLMFHDTDWSYGSGRLGVTTPSGGTESGLLLDADVEINAQDYSFESDASGLMSVSLLYVLTHELGHFLGLAHSNVNGSVMSAGFQSLPFSPNLISSDDAAAICAAYPPGGPLNCGEPPAPAYDTCQLGPGEAPPCTLSSVTQDASSCGCDLARSSGHGTAPSLAALGLMLAALSTRRARAKRRSAVA